MSCLGEIGDGEGREDVPLMPNIGVVIFFHERCLHRELLPERLAGSDVETYLVFGLSGVAVVGIFFVGGSIVVSAGNIVVVLLRTLVS